MNESTWSALFRLGVDPPFVCGEAGNGRGRIVTYPLTRRLHMAADGHSIWLGNQRL